MEKTTGITMSAGIVSPVKGFGRMEGLSTQRVARVDSEVKQPISIQEFKKTKESEFVFDKKERTNSPENKDQLSLEELKSPNERAAEKILEAAKKDGVSNTFEKLAMGEFNEDDPEIQEKSIDKDELTKQDLESSKGQISKEAVNPEIKVSPVELRIAELENNINNLAAQNQKLEKHAEVAQKLARDGISTALELAKILQEMLEEKNNDNSQQDSSLIEKLMNLIVRALMLVTMSDADIKKVDDESREKEAA